MLFRSKVEGKQTHKDHLYTVHTYICIASGGVPAMLTGLGRLEIYLLSTDGEIAQPD